MNDNDILKGLECLVSGSLLTTWLAPASVRIAWPL